MMAVTSMNSARMAPVNDFSLSKESMMVRNIQLLGFHAEYLSDTMSMDSKMSSTWSHSHSNNSSTVTNSTGLNMLHPHMFDRPNEKTLFKVLYFLLGKISPAWKADIRFCWPVTTPHDKTNFKKHVQSLLHELEKAGHLPLGSSQASRINSGCGPRLIDLIWRLSTYAVRVTLETLPAYKLVPPSSAENASVTEAIMALKAKIAMKTHRIQEKCMERSRVQDQWVDFASDLSKSIQDLHTLQSQVQEDQAKLDAQAPREVYSQTGQLQRQMAIESITNAWKTIEHFNSSGLLEKQANLLDKAHTNCQSQPVLNTSMILGQQDRKSSRMDLTQIVHDAELILRAAHSRLFHGKIRMFLEKQDLASMKNVLSTSTHSMALLKTMVQQLKQLVQQINQNNEQSIRDLYVEQVTKSSSGTSSTNSLGLCPPTPISPSHQKNWEEKLSASLQKASIHELSDLAANSVRSTTWKKKHRKWLEPDYETINSSGSISRRLEYTEGDFEEEMEF